MLAVPAALWTGKLTRKPGAAGASSKSLRSKAIMFLSFRCTIMCTEYREAHRACQRIVVHYCAMNRRYERKSGRGARRRRGSGSSKPRSNSHERRPRADDISGIAERAGVERHTVYAHFPDDRTLFRACSEHWAARQSMPDLETLAEIENPVRRLRRALGEIYAWYESVEADLALFIRDASLVPANAEALGEMTADFAILADAVSQGWPRRKSVRAAIGHALEFETWRSLVRRQGLSERMRSTRWRVSSRASSPAPAPRAAAPSTRAG